MPRGIYKLIKNGAIAKAHQTRIYTCCYVCGGINKKMTRIAHKDRTKDHLDRLYCTPCYMHFIE